MTKKHNDAWMTDFLWHRHENDDDMENLAYLSLTFILQTMLHQGVEPVVVKKGKEWDLCCRGRGTQALLLGPGYVD